MPIAFPAEVKTRLVEVFGGYPDWDLIFAALGRVIANKKLENIFVADLERLCTDPVSFQWPLDHPDYCLLLGHMRDYLQRFEAKLSDDEAEDLEDGDDPEQFIERLRTDEIYCLWLVPQ